MMMAATTANHRVAATGQIARIRKAFGERHAHSSAERRAEAGVQQAALTADVITGGLRLKAPGR
jgi:hypothetical protein